MNDSQDRYTEPEQPKQIEIETEKIARRIAREKGHGPLWELYLSAAYAEWMASDKPVG